MNTTYAPELKLGHHTRTAPECNRGQKRSVGRGQQAMRKWKKTEADGRTMNLLHFIMDRSQWLLSMKITALELLPCTELKRRANLLNHLLSSLMLLFCLWIDPSFTLHLSPIVLPLLSYGVFFPLTQSPCIHLKKNLFVFSQYYVSLNLYFSFQDFLDINLYSFLTWKVS